MTKIFILSIIVGFLLVPLKSCKNEETTLKERPNILFIAVDDLRPELNCYGSSHIKSPNIDKLAREGYLFERAYCNVPVCGASRASVLTGLRPTPTRFLRYDSSVNKDAPDVKTLPQHFKENGYRTLSLGKIFHDWNSDNLQGWSQQPWHPEVAATNTRGWGDYWAENVLRDSITRRGPTYEIADVHDSIYYDGRIAQKAIRELRELSKTNQPFFMGLGFLKPHLPFNAPTKYWDLYDHNTIELPKNHQLPKNSPDEANHSFGEMRHYYGVPEEGPIPDSLSLKLIRGYYASVSYTDALIGQVLKELKTLELTNNTIIVLWGDHGWSLGEHGLWCKHSTFDVAMRAPLFLKIPGKRAGEKIQALTEFVDIYPSLCELAGLRKPSHLQGDSFISLLENPKAKGKESVFSRYRNADAIKTNRYLYTEWFDDNGQTISHMLYNHQDDPQETVNIADAPENESLVRRFSNELRVMREIE